MLLDTDQSIFNKNPNYSDAANLDNADKIHCSVYEVETLRKNLREYSNLRDWLDPKTLSGDIHQGAGAVRARGRLAYFWNYDQIAKRIEEEALEITKDASKAQAIKNGLAGVRGRDGLSGRLAPGRYGVGDVSGPGVHGQGFAQVAADAGDGRHLLDSAEHAGGRGR